MTLSPIGGHHRTRFFDLGLTTPPRLWYPLRPTRMVQTPRFGAGRDVVETPERGLDRQIAARSRLRAAKRLRESQLDAVSLVRSQRDTGPSVSTDHDVHLAARLRARPSQA